MKVLNLASAQVELHDDDLTLSRYRFGEVHARPHDTEVYRERARAHGYGDDIALMSREHEIGHHLLAECLGLPYSPTLAGVAKGNHWPWHEIEECAVLALQAFARATGVSLVARAERWPVVRS